jgi:hypothetical protein
MTNVFFYVLGSQDQSKVVSLYSKIALGLSGGLFIFAVILMMTSVLLKKKWYKTAKSMQNDSTASNELKPIENLVFMEETILENVRRKERK